MDKTEFRRLMEDRIAKLEETITRLIQVVSVNTYRHLMQSVEIEERLRRLDGSPDLLPELPTLLESAKTLFQDSEFQARMDTVDNLLKEDIRKCKNYLEVGRFE